MARVDVIMPQMGESIAEGTVSKWLKKVGDPVKRDEPILEISTDKVDAEIPSPATGVLVEIAIGEGKTVPVQTVVAFIETDKTAAGTPPAPAAAPAPASAAAPSPAAVAPAAPNPAPPVRPVAAPPSAPARAPVPVASMGGVQTAEERLRQRSTPLVRRIAAEHNVDISRLTGSGYAGRVTKNDLLQHIAETPASPAPVAPAPTVPAGPSAAGGVSHPTVEPWPGDRVEPMSKIRKLTADHMIASRRTSAHVTSFYEVDFTRIARLRQRKKQEYEQRGAKLTYLGFIAKVAADHLRRHPVINAS
ncbi:MAG: 2-oxo acid dehydrogenase subunit E2, partial [Sporichthyaceae bacterium]|nr:2-oxo acid dehydrogenase subunit E2 [Sporichthyaceae bacterium]